ncbi:MIF4G-domain-containing protein [Wilcoxina mikolae CBS 423.85]|nr:MIF4G-domain-containing protein [Wilcoxina mikolae CBS 423.85]
MSTWSTLVFDAQRRQETVRLIPAAPPALNPQLQLTTESKPDTPSIHLSLLRAAQPIQNLEALQYPGGIQSTCPTLNPFADVAPFKYDNEFLMQFQTICTWKVSVDWDQRIQEIIGETNPGRPSMMGPRYSGPFSRQKGVLNTFSVVQSNSEPDNDLWADELEDYPLYADENWMSQATIRSKVDACLSTMTSENFEKIADELLEISSQSKNESNATTLRTVTHQTFEKAIMESVECASLCAKICKRMMQLVNPSIKDESFPGIITSGNLVRRYLLDKCQKSFEQGRKINQTRDSQGRRYEESKSSICTRTEVDRYTDMFSLLNELDYTQPYPRPGPSTKNLVNQQSRLEPSESSPVQGDLADGLNSTGPDLKPGPSEPAQILTKLSDESSAPMAYRRYLGVIRFQGELFLVGMLTERIMHSCIKKLLEFDDVPEDVAVVGLSILIGMVGSKLDASGRSKPIIDSYFTRIEALIENESLNSRMKSVLMDVVELRKKHWETEGGFKFSSEFEVRERPQSEKRLRYPGPQIVSSPSPLRSRT